MTTPGFLGRPLEPANVLAWAGVVSRACRLFSYGTGGGYASQPVTVRCEVLRSASGQEWAPPRAHPLDLAPHARASRINVMHVWVLCHDFAELQRHTAAVMLEDRACDVARCGKSEDVCPLGVGADDVGPSCCVVVHRRDLLQRVVCPSREMRKPAMLWPILAVSSAWSLASGHSFPNSPLEVLPSAALLTCTVHTCMRQIHGVVRPPGAFERWQHLAARLVDVDDAAANGEKRQRTPSVSRCSFMSTMVTGCDECPAPVQNEKSLQARDTTQAKARTTDGSRERGRPGNPGVIMANHLRLASQHGRP